MSEQETSWPGVFELKEDGTLSHVSTVECRYVPDGIHMNISAAYVDEMEAAQCSP